ncbi:hypothetical protein EHM76_01915, partial [bacterium]
MKNHLIKKVVFLAVAFILVFPMSTTSMALSPAQANTNTAASFQGQTQGEQTQRTTSHRLIVELTSPPLVNVADSIGLSRLPDGHLDMNAPEVQNYITQLQAEQATFINAVTAAIPGSSVGTYMNELGETLELTYQLVFNGVVVDPGDVSPEVARKQIWSLPGVRAVYHDYAYDPTMYASLPLINAPAMWERVGGQDDAGRGIKVASMDGGVHNEAPMFSGEGFSYPPGFPIQGLGASENNNGKIIASRVYFRTWDPPAPGDENPWPGRQGTSHGVHTTGTAAGNPVVADYIGITETISGVAPAAWIMSYRVFYYSVTGDESFYTAEGLQALEDVVADGADVLNNSWGGGPSSTGGQFDPLDTALINASNAGVFVVMSAGNAGPGSGTLDHPSDQYISVAASSTTGTFSAGDLSVTAPTPVPDTLKGIPFAQSGFGPAHELSTSYAFLLVPGEAVDPANFEG